MTFSLSMKSSAVFSFTIRSGHRSTSRRTASISCHISNFSSCQIPRTVTSCQCLLWSGSSLASKKCCWVASWKYSTAMFWSGCICQGAARSSDAVWPTSMSQASSHRDRRTNWYSVKNCSEDRAYWLPLCQRRPHKNGIRYVLCISPYSLTTTWVDANSQSLVFGSLVFRYPSFIECPARSKLFDLLRSCRPLYIWDRALGQTEPWAVISTNFVSIIAILVCLHILSETRGYSNGWLLSL